MGNRGQCKGLICVLIGLAPKAGRTPDDTQLQPTDGRENGAAGIAVGDQQLVPLATQRWLTHGKHPHRAGTRATPATHTHTHLSNFSSLSRNSVDRSHKSCMIANFL